MRYYCTIFFPQSTASWGLLNLKKVIKKKTRQFYNTSYLLNADQRAVTAQMQVVSPNNYEQNVINNPRIPQCTVSDFGEEEIITKNEVKQNKVFNPLSFNESEIIAKEIINGNNVIVNLEDLLALENGSKIAKRIIDFLCGTSFACKVSVKRINDSTFIFSK